MLDRKGCLEGDDTILELLKPILEVALPHNPFVS